MRLTTTGLASLAIAALAAQQSALAFAPPHRHLSVRTPADSTAIFQASTDGEDCGCGATTFSGKPSEKALKVDARQSIGANPIYNVNGEQTDINEQIGNSGTAIVVFLRSLG